MLLNYKNIDIMCKEYNSLKEIQETKLFQKFNISPISFIMLQKMAFIYFSTGINEFQATDIMQQSYQEMTILEKSEYQDIDEVILTTKHFKLIEDLEVLLSFGYIIFIENVYKDYDIHSLFAENFKLTDDFFTILNDVEEQHFKMNNAEYRTNSEFIVDIADFMDNRYRYMIARKYFNHLSPITELRTKSMNNIKKQIEKRLEKTSINLPLIKTIEKYNLSEAQSHILMMLYISEYNDHYKTYCSENALDILFYEETDNNTTEIIDIEQNYGFEDGLLEVVFPENDIYMFEDVSPTYQMSDTFFDEMKDLLEEDVKENILNIGSKLENIVKELDYQVITEHKVKISDLILNKDTTNLIDTLLNQLNPEVFKKLKEWGIKDTDDFDARILLHGEPGTGKTATAYAIASELNKAIITFDCSKILSMYIGESEKKVKQIFDTYREIGKKLKYTPILLLNEADQFLGKRSDGSDSADKMHNQMQNIFLEELENFTGILIATTNLKENFDKAFSRRFNFKIDFKLPDKNERLKIWKLKLKKLPLSEKFNFDILRDAGSLSGGQIEMIIKNTAIYNAIAGKEIFEEKDFLVEIKKEIAAAFGKESVVGFFN